MTANWQRVLGQLQLQMTAAAFGSFLAGSMAEEPADGELVIHAQSETARAWLEGRLAETVAAAVATVYGPGLALRFVNGAEAVEGLQVEGLRVGEDESCSIMTQDDESCVIQTQDTRLDSIKLITRLDFDAAWRKNYSIVSHYVSHFWLPYLGPAFSLWKRLEADHRIPVRQRDLKVVSNRWTQGMRFYYRQLARMINKDNPRVVKGGEVECWQSMSARRDRKPLVACCGNPDFQPVRSAPDQAGCVRCMHWQIGLLEVLFQEGLIAIREKKGERWANRLDIQVWRLLPILTPQQVDLLNDDLRQEHERWIEGRSDRPALGEALGISLAEWEQIEAKSWVPFLEGYREGRQYWDEFCPSESFLATASVKQPGDFF